MCVRTCDILCLWTVNITPVSSLFFFQFSSSNQPPSLKEKTYWPQPTHIKNSFVYMHAVQLPLLSTISSGIDHTMYTQKSFCAWDGDQKYYIGCIACRLSYISVKNNERLVRRSWKVVGLFLAGGFVGIIVIWGPVSYIIDTHCNKWLEVLQWDSGYGDSHSLQLHVLWQWPCSQ